VEGGGGVILLVVAFSRLPTLSAMEAADALRLRPLKEVVDMAGLAAAGGAADVACKSKPAYNVGTLSFRHCRFHGITLQAIAIPTIAKISVTPLPDIKE